VNVSIGITTPNPKSTHDTVLLEWTAKTPGGASYDGGAPRELIRLRQPFANHNGGHLAFNPTAAAGSAERGWLYMGIADGGSGGDPMALAQNMSSAFGKIIRIGHLGYFGQYLGVWLLFPTLPLAAGLLVWLVLMSDRMRNEERVLARAFPEYGEYRRRVSALGFYSARRMTS
jgi:hypothetical protein